MRSVVAVATAGAVVALAGCTGAYGSLEQSTEQSSSAVATSQLGLRLFRQGKAPAAWSRTAFSDMLTAISKAEKSVTQLDAKDAAQRAAQQKTLRAVRRAHKAILDAREVASGTPGAPSRDAASEALAEAGRALNWLKAQWRARQ